MKNFTRIFTVIALAGAMVFGMSSCDGSMMDISVNPDPIVVGWGGDQITVAVSAPAEWIVEANDAWFTVGKVDNGSIAIVAEPNQVNRTGSLTITALGMTQTFTVSQGLTADDLVGTWASSESRISSGSRINNDHNVYMTKIDANTVKITNVMNLNNVLVSAPDPNTTDSVIATIDSQNATISIAPQGLVPTFESAGNPVEVCRILNSFFSNTTPPGTYADNWGLGFDNIPVNGNTIDLAEGGYQVGTVGGTPLYGSFIILCKDPAGATPGIYGFGWYFCETKWTKTSNDPTPLPVAPAPIDKVNDNIEFSFSGVLLQ